MENRSLFQSQWVARKITKLRRKRQKRQISHSITKTTECKIRGFRYDRPFWFTRAFTKICWKKMHCCPFPDFIWFWQGWICSWARICLEKSQNEITDVILLVFLLLFIFSQLSPLWFLITFILFSPTTIRNFFFCKSNFVVSYYHSEINVSVGTETFDLHLIPGRIKECVGSN